MRSLGAAALSYAARGWPVFPLEARGKRPIVEHGLKDATTDADTITRWWDATPNANVGVRTGDAFHVLDLDGPDGIDTFANLVATDYAGDLPYGPCVTTGGGGMHLYFAPPERTIGNRAGFLRKCDWRGVGGYVVAPESIHASGNVYSWSIDPDEPLPTIPLWLIEVLSPTRPRPEYVPPMHDGRSVSPWAHKALDDECARVANAAPGTRNDTLNRAAFNLGQLVAGGELDYEETFGRLHGAAMHAGLRDGEARATTESGMDSAASSPRRRPSP